MPLYLTVCFFSWDLISLPLQKDASFYLINNEKGLKHAVNASDITIKG